MKMALDFRSAKIRTKCATVVPEPKPTAMPAFTSFAAALADAFFQASTSN
jgi:hypothetical protein